MISIKVLPYLVVLITAIAGVNVFVVLFGGIVLAGPYWPLV